MNPTLVPLSKLLSQVLRHRPEKIGLVLDPNGWADIAELLRLAAQHGQPITRAVLDEIVATNDKKRFAVSADGLRIRANQGHSIAVDLALRPSTPPALLYHGTASRSLQSIRSQGLLPGRRRHVHLSLDEATARTVGARHGTPVVLVIRAGAMSKEGHEFYRSDNGVWLTERVPRAYIEFADCGHQ